MRGDVLIDLTFERMRLEDLKEVAFIEKNCYGLAWTVGMFEREISFPISHFFVTRGSSCPEILGYGGFWKILEEAHLINLTIRPERQRQGFGRRLLRFFLEEARRLGLTRATLEVRPSNTAAVRLYESEGFIGAAVRRGYYSDNGEDALVMWREKL